MIELYPEIVFDLDITNNARSSTNLAAQIKNHVLAVLLDHFPLNPSFGINLPKVLGRTNPAAYNDLASKAKVQIEADERIRAAKVEFQGPNNNGFITVIVNVTPIDNTEVINITLNDLIRI